MFLLFNTFNWNTHCGHSNLYKTDVWCPVAQASQETVVCSGTYPMWHRGLYCPWCNPAALCEHGTTRCRMCKHTNKQKTSWKHNLTAETQEAQRRASWQLFVELTGGLPLHNEFSNDPPDEVEFKEPALPLSEAYDSDHLPSRANSPMDPSTMTVNDDV